MRERYGNNPYKGDSSGENKTGFFFKEIYGEIVIKEHSEILML